VGKILGGATVAWLQGMAFVGLAPLAGFPFAHVQYLSLALILALAAIGLTGLGFALAWKIESTQGYHAVVSLLLIPLWVVSGAMFPAHDGPLFIVMRANPVAYLVDGVRQAFYGGVTPANLGLGAPWGLDLGVSAIFALVAVAVAAVACQRR
jgi:ABC-type polysaccharide/polyol phosphate export permease